MKRVNKAEVRDTGGPEHMAFWRPFPPNRIRSHWTDAEFTCDDKGLAVRNTLEKAVN